VEPLPIADFRTLSGTGVAQPSPDLLDTVYQCQQRQDWFREYLRTEGYEPLYFVNSVSVRTNPESVASSIREAISLDVGARLRWRTFEDALRGLVEQIEAAGVLVMRNGVVGNNTHRTLDVKEFRGFTLCDEYAPLIFVNAADSKSAQMFTLVHELAHVWLGQSGVSDASVTPSHSIERFSNAVAAETLVPMTEFREVLASAALDTIQAGRIALHFKVSPLVVLIRALQGGILSQGGFDALAAVEREKDHGTTRSSGGDFYRTQSSRLGRRFARAVIISTLEGRTLYRDAFRLLGVRKTDTFQKLAISMGVIP
jgi:Zn-dependent peptidase ImmA (M78 family)